MTVKREGTGLTAQFTGIGSVISGSIASGSIGAVHIASGTVIAGGISSGEIQSSMIADAAIISRTIGSGQISSGNMTSGFIDGLERNSILRSGQVQSGNIGDSAIVSGSISSGQIGGGHLADSSVSRPKIASGTPAWGTRIECVAAQPISGLIAVAFNAAGDGTIVPAERQSGLRLPAIGVTMSGAASGLSCSVIINGPVTTAASGMLPSGFLNSPLFVGSGGLIVSQSGFVEGLSSGDPFISGCVIQHLGIAISGGIYVSPNLALFEFSVGILSGGILSGGIL